MHLIEKIIQAKSIAVVGNAQGDIDPLGQLDSFHIVARLNNGFRLPSDGSRGSRTDFIFTSSMECLADAEKISIPCVWMTPKNRADLVHLPAEKFLFYSVDDWAALCKSIGSRPSTGVMAVDFLLNLNLGVDIKLFGFNFYQSKNFNGRGKGFRCPHDFVREKEIVEGYVDSGRLRFQPVHDIEVRRFFNFRNFFS